MATYSTRKSSAAAKRQTIAARQARAMKRGALSVSRAGHVRRSA